MIRLALAAAFAATALSTAASADARTESCGHQAAVVAAIQTARLDGVAETSVAAHITGAEHSWPDQYDAAIPLMAPWVYEQKRRDLRNNDLSAAWSELCLAQ